MEAATHHADVVALLRSHSSPVEATRIQHLLQERLASIRQLADRLEREGVADAGAQAALLRRAARDPEPASWYALNDQPVLTTWGPEPPPVEAVPVSLAVEPPSAPPVQPLPRADAATSRTGAGVRCVEIHGVQHENGPERGIGAFL